MLFDSGIIRNYDIRGEYGKDFDDEFAKLLGAAVVAQFKAKTLVVARDERESSTVLAQAVIKGITASGCDVIDIGVASTPFFYYVVTNKNVPAGIMITASHMGEAFNGFKICKHDGMVLAKETGLPELMELLPDTLGQGKGNITTPDFRDEHADVVIKHSGLVPGESTMRVALEAGDMIRKEFEPIAKKLNLAYVQNSPDIIFVFDADGDRILVKNKAGDLIRGDLIGGLIASRMNYRTVVYDIRYSRGVVEYLVALNIRLVPSRIGHTLIKKAMRDADADFCGEGSGHTMFKVMNSVESAMLLALLVLKILATEKKTIGELVQPMQTWFLNYEINIPIAGWPNSVPAILEKVKAHYQDAKVSELDGLKVDYPDWWFLLRASSNDPVIRLIVEAKTKELVEEKTKEVQALIIVPSSA